MAFSQEIRHGVSLGSDAVDKAKSYSGSLSVKIDEDIADAETDKQITVALDVSAVKAFYLVSDQAVTVETNSGSTPADTITLVANVPYVWTTDSYDTFLLGTDVTALFITNSSGSSANVKMFAVVDSTP